MASSAVGIETELPQVLHHRTNVDSSSSYDEKHSADVEASKVVDLDEIEVQDAYVVTRVFGLNRALSMFFYSTKPFPIEEGEMIEDHQLTFRAVFVGCCLGAVGAICSYLRTSACAN